MLLPIHTQNLIIRRFAETELADMLAYQTHPETFRYLAMESVTEEKAVAFLKRQADPESWAGAGWLLHGDYHERGYASEAAPVPVRYAFEERGLHRRRAGPAPADVWVRRPQHGVLASDGAAWNAPGSPLQAKPASARRLGRRVSVRTAARGMAHPAVSGAED